MNSHSGFLCDIEYGMDDQTRSNAQKSFMCLLETRSPADLDPSTKA